MNKMKRELIMGMPLHGCNNPPQVPNLYAYSAEKLLSNTLYTTLV